MYTLVNYVLMFTSFLLIGGLVSGLIYLYAREISLAKQRHNERLQEILKRRRQAFSGQSGCHSTSVSDGLETEDPPFQDLGNDAERTNIWPNT